LAYQVRLAQSVRLQLREAPAQLQGYLDGVIAFLRVDPTAASVAFPVIAGGRFRTIVFADGHAFLDYQVFEDSQVVLIVDLTWLE
jgi:prepilin-type processing-associated H-X9-DG protein